PSHYPYHSATNTLSLHDALPIYLNSQLGTTPALLNYPQDSMLNFGIVASFSNCSDTSNLAMRKLPRLNKEPSDLFVDPTTVWDIDRKSTRLNSSHVSISYAVFSL